MILRYFLYEWTGWFWQNECKQKENVKKQKLIFWKFAGALDDFDAGNAAKGADKNAEPGQDNANAEIWNEEFVA